MAWIGFMTLITCYALFADDLRIIFFAKDMDEFFSWMTFVCIFLYTFEFMAGSCVIKGYLNSFFFWIDVLSTVSMVPDCSWLWALFVDPD